MKIRFLIQNIYALGGTVRTVANLCEYLIQKEYDVEIISIRRTSEKPKFTLSSSISIVTLYDARPDYLLPSSMPRLKRTIKSILIEKPSRIIHKEEDLYCNFNRYIDLLLMRRLKKLRDGVLVTTMPSLNMLASKYVHKSVLCIGQEHKGLSQHSESIQQLIRRSYGKLDALTILTESNIEKYRSLILEQNVKIYQLGNGTEMTYIRSPLESKTIISAGRYTDTKRFDWLIESFAKIADEFTDWNVKIFGDGTLRSALKEKILSLGLEHQVFLAPSSDQILTEFSKASIFACTSKEEGFGMVIIEAMSVGLPCVSFACDGPSEIIQNDIDGYLIPIGNTDSFAYALKKLMSDKALRIRMGRAALMDVEHYSIHSIGEKFESILRDCTNEVP